MEYIIKINDNDETDSDGGKRVEEMHRLVRCKDCRHCTFYDGEQLADCMIKQGWVPVKPDWFCADGEMKEGDGE